MKMGITTVEFAESAMVFAEVAAKRHGQAWLCSIRSKMRMPRDDFEALALAAHQEGLLELSRADLTGAADERYLTESELVVPNSTHTFHFLRRD